MRATPFFVVVVAVLLAGCSGGGDDRTPAGPAGFGDDPAEPGGTDPGNVTLPPPAEDSGPAVRIFNETFNLMIRQAKAVNPTSGATYQVNLGNNCVNFGKGSVWLVFNGTAEATWSSTNQFTERLIVEIWDGGGQARLESNDGSTSPSRLDFDQFR